MNNKIFLHKQLTPLFRDHTPSCRVFLLNKYHSERERSTDPPMGTKIPFRPKTFHSLLIMFLYSNTRNPSSLFIYSLFSLLKIIALSKQTKLFLHTFCPSSFIKSLRKSLVATCLWKRGPQFFTHASETLKSKKQIK